MNINNFTYKTYGNGLALEIFYGNQSIAFYQDEAAHEILAEIEKAEDLDVEKREKWVQELLANYGGFFCYINNNDKMFT
jgi:hypothetical protein